jgi:hypothetical protein
MRRVAAIGDDGLCERRPRIPLIGVILGAIALMDLAVTVAVLMAR